MPWDDQGLYFTLLLNATAMCILVPIAYKLHCSENKSTKRILRPRHSHDTKPLQSAIFSLATWNGIFNSETDYYEKGADQIFCGKFIKKRTRSRASIRDCEMHPSGIIYLLCLKTAASIFICGSCITVWICTVAGSDDYLTRLAWATDPNGCRGKSPADCRSSYLFCVFQENTNVCHIAPVEGLYNLSIQNIHPGSWRWWLVSIFSLWFTLVLCYRVWFFLKATTTFSEVVTTKELLQAEGYRTVVVRGTKHTGEEESCPFFSERNFRNKYLNLDKYFTAGDDEDKSQSGAPPTSAASDAHRKKYEKQLDSPPHGENGVGHTLRGVLARRPSVKTLPLS